MKTLIQSFWLVCFFLLVETTNCQTLEKSFYGKWKIVEMTSIEKNNPEETINNCMEKNIVIDKRGLKINSSSCILESFKKLQIEFESKLELQDAKNKFGEKFLTHIFYSNNLDQVNIYKTNYKRKEDEGLGGENWIGKGDLHIIEISNKKILLFGYGYIFSLEKIMDRF